MEQFKKEIDEERQLQELQRLQEVSGQKKRAERLDWMYGSGSAYKASDPSNKEDYLLGKKKINELIEAPKEEKLYSGLTEEYKTAASIRDLKANL